MSDIGDRGLNVYDIRLTPAHLFPLSLSTDLMLSTALASARLRSNTKSRLQKLLQTESMQRALECLYWLAFSKQFLPESSLEVQQILRKQLSAHYAKMLVSRLHSAQTDYLQFVPVLFTHCICTDLYKRFLNSRSALTADFILSVARMIHWMLFGVETSEVYIRQKLYSLYRSQVFGLDIAAKTTQEPDERKVSTCVLTKMKEVSGGVDFAKELYKLADRRAKQQQAKLPLEEDQFAGLTEAKLEKVVGRYSSKRAASAGTLRRLQPFDCSSLSPLLASQLATTVGSIQTNLRLQKVRAIHPLDLSSTMPRSIQLLVRFQDQQRKNQENLEDQRKAEELVRFKSSQSKLHRRFRLGEGLSRQGVEQSPCLEEVVKLRNELRDRPQVTFWRVWD